MVAVCKVISGYIVPTDQKIIMLRLYIKPIAYGFLGVIALIAVYFVVVGLISELDFAKEQFAE